MLEPEPTLRVRQAPILHIPVHNKPPGRDREEESDISDTYLGINICGTNHFLQQN